MLTTVIILVNQVKIYSIYLYLQTATVTHRAQLLLRIAALEHLYNRGQMESITSQHITSEKSWSEYTCTYALHQARDHNNMQRVHISSAPLRLMLAHALFMALKHTYCTCRHVNPDDCGFTLTPHTLKQSKQFCTACHSSPNPQIYSIRDI